MFGKTGREKRGPVRCAKEERSLRQCRRSPLPQSTTRDGTYSIDGDGHVLQTSQNRTRPAWECADQEVSLEPEYFSQARQGPPPHRLHQPVADDVIEPQIFQGTFL